MSNALYPGSFDPVTYGHIDIIKRAARIFDTLTVGVLNNNVKSPLFSVEERVKMLQTACAGIPNVSISSWQGLLAEYARQAEVDVIIRGLRAVTDFEYELQMAQTNKKLNPKVETVFLTASLEYAYLSSSVVREVAAFGGDIGIFVPDFVAREIYLKLRPEGVSGRAEDKDTDNEQ
ncbi:MAG: pantetheine-phosphate adenylyltransferase [Lachnospiraceae bacterium]|nr:pantetheine-phosphate adenylyltransferase [Lachnospiraceae bacterium]